ncbi:MAG: hypothetical protein AAFQ82_27660 [Myxococcota bacterium]
MKRWLGWTPLLAPLAPVLLLLGALFGGSRMPSAAALDTLTPRFETTDSSELFFKNIRSIHYEKRDGPAQGYDLYHLRGLDDAPFQAFLVHHWLADKAYLMFEPERGPSKVLIDGREVSLARELPDDAFRTAMTLCAAYERNVEIVSLDNEVLSSNKRHSKLFLRLCRDYLELVELF